MPDLVTLSDLKDHLGDASSMDFSLQGEADTYLTAVLDRVEDMLERATGQVFHAGGTETDEPTNGKGFDWIEVERPISSLTSVKIGFDPDDPDVTLSDTPDEVQAISFTPGGRKTKVKRRDGGVFPTGVHNVYVTYDYAAYTPEVAQAAVLEGAAYLLRRRGSEHAASRSVGEFGSTEYAALFDNLPTWQKAVGQLQGFQVA